MIPIIKQVPPECVGGKTLFVGTDGRFYNKDGRELKPHITEPRNRVCCHTRYPFMSGYASRICHHLVWETFVGPRTKGLEIDHINGNKLDWSLDNLEEVTPAENRKRAVLLRALRKAGRDPKTMTREQLLALFSHYQVSNPNDILNYEFNHHMEC